MRILYIDIDTLRPDHLGCYGYHRDTSPNIDRLADQAVRFEKVYVSDAPCLPSRASMFSGQFGIHTGVVGHGGTAADMRLIGRERGFRTTSNHAGFIECLRRLGYYPVSVSPFAERHSAWWFYEGWREMINTGKGGAEQAHEVVPAALDWLDRRGSEDNWMLHVNVWDPHTDYITPEEFGNPFADDPAPDWYTEQIRQAQWDSFGPGTPQEPCGAYGQHKEQPLMPKQIDSMAAYKRWIDGYDAGIRYADQWVGKLLDKLESLGVLDDTAIIVTSDHGENQGELGVMGDHATADHVTSRVPMILRWPGADGPRVDRGLYNQCDIAATIVELAGGAVPDDWDGRSFADSFRAGSDGGRDYAVFSQMAWSCQRAVRWGDWLLIHTYHTGLKNYPRQMLFDIAADPHETTNLAASRPELVAHGEALLAEWHERMMKTSPSPVDPLHTVLVEGGPFHTRNRLGDYCDRLRATGRSHHADFLQANPTGLAEA